MAASGPRAGYQESRRGGVARILGRLRTLAAGAGPSLHGLQGPAPSAIESSHAWKGAANDRPRAWQGALRYLIELRGELTSYGVSCDVQYGGGEPHLRIYFPADITVAKQPIDSVTWAVSAAKGGSARRRLC